MGQRLPLADPALDLGEGGLSQHLFSDVPGDHRQRHEGGVAVEDGAGAERDGREHAIAAPDLGFEVADPVAGGDRLEDGGHISLQVGRKEESQVPAHDLRRRVPEDALGAAIPTGDVAFGVETEHGVVGDVDDRLEHSHLVRPPRRGHQSMLSAPSTHRTSVAPKLQHRRRTALC